MIFDLVCIHISLRFLLLGGVSRYSTDAICERQSLLRFGFRSTSKQIPGGSRIPGFPVRIFLGSNSYR